MAQDVDPVALANTAAGVVDHANVWTVIVVFILVAGALVGLYLWKLPTEKETVKEPCNPTGDCPGIKHLSVKLDLMAEQMREDREEWRSHRQSLEGAIRGVHSRVDELYRGR